MKKIFLILMIVGICALVFAQDKKLSDPANDGASEELLKKEGIGTSVEELSKFILGDEKEIKKLIKDLGDESQKIRESATNRLIKIGEPCLPFVKEAEKFKDPEVKYRARHILKKISESSSGERQKVILAAIRILGRSKNTKAIKLLLKLLRDSNIRYSAIHALAKIGRPAIEPLIEALKDEEYCVRCSAAYVLGEIGDKKAVEPLIETLKKDKDGWARFFAAKALGNIGDKRAVEPLIEALKDEDRNVRSSATEALGKIGDKRAVKSLIEALEDKHKYVRKYAAWALGKIKDKSAVQPLIKVLKEEEATIRCTAASALADIADKSTVQLLQKIYKEDKDKRVQVYTAYALVKIEKNINAFKFLISALKDKDSYVRSSAAKLLGGIGDKKAVEPLIEALKDKSWRLRCSAAEALANIGDKSAVKPLIEALKKDKVCIVRSYAASALKEITGTGKNFGEDYNKWKEWWEKNKKEKKK